MEFASHSGNGEHNKSSCHETVKNSLMLMHHSQQEFINLTNNCVSSSPSFMDAHIMSFSLLSSLSNTCCMELGRGFHR